MKTAPQVDLSQILGLDGLTPAERNDTLSTIANLIFEAVLVRSIPLVKETRLDAFEKTLDSKDDEAVFAFLEKEVPKFRTIVDDEIETFRKMAERVMPAVV